MGKRMIPVVVLLLLMLSACGQKGPLFLPVEPQSPAASEPVEPGVNPLEEVEPGLEPPAETMDEQTLEVDEDFDDGEDDQ